MYSKSVFHQHLRICFSLAFLVLVTSCGNCQSLTILHVNVVDVEANRVLPDHWIEIVDGRISGVGPMTTRSLNSQTPNLDATGLFAYPALFDCHVHLNEPRRDSLMMVANGVLYARDMGGSTSKRIALREKSRKGELNGLKLSVTGTILDGKPPYHSWSTSCDTEAQGRDAVRALHRSGVDQIKVYSLLKPDVYRAIADEAKRLNMEVVGHVPDAVSMKDAIAAGQKSVEHLSRFETLLEDEYSEQAKKIKREGAFSSGLWSLYPRLPLAERQRLLKPLADERIAQCPTIVLFLGQARIAPDSWIQEAWSTYINTDEKPWWTSEIPSEWAVYGESLRTSLPLMLDALRDMHEAKVPLLVGTDLANLGVLAGFSVHQEMRIWQEAGIPPGDILRYATLEPARFLKQDSEYGSIDVGKSANLVLVDKNPLLDIRHAASIHSLIVQGKQLKRDDLDSMLHQAKREFEAKQSQPTTKDPFVLAGEGVVERKFDYLYQQWPSGGETYRTLPSDQGVAFEAQIDYSGWDTPFRISGMIQRDGQLQFLQYKSLTKVPVEWSMEIEARTATAKCSLGAVLDSEKQFEVDRNDLLLVSWTVVEQQLKHVALEVGQSIENKTIGWNSSLREFEASPSKLTRRDDEDLEWNGSKVRCNVYVTLTTPPADRIAHKIWISKEGRLLRAVRQEGSELRSAVAVP